MTARVRYDRVYHVIPANYSEEQAVEIFRAAWRNNRQTVGGSYDDAGIGDGLASKRAILHGINQADRHAFISFYSRYYPDTIVEFAPLSTPPAPAKRNAYLLGVNCLNDADSARWALQNGCKAVGVMDNNGAAIQFARDYPDAFVFMRAYYPSAWTPEYHAEKLDAHRTDVPVNCVATVLNEADFGWGYDSVEAIERRFNYERRVCEIIWNRQPNRVVSIGAWSHGTPDTTNADIVNVYAKTYGAFAAANAQRCYLNFHLYTKGKRFQAHPPADAQIIDPIWFEGRFADLHAKARLPNTITYCSDETGVEAGHGGMPWANYTEAQVVEWCNWWVSYISNLSPTLKFSTIFQFGDHAGWRGYDMRRYKDVVKTLWQQ